MAKITNLPLVLDEILATLPELPLPELVELAPHWAQLHTYMQQPNAQEAEFYTKLKELVKLSPTLVSHRFSVILENYSSRFSDEPGPNHNQPSSTQGIPPVHNEVIRIADKLKELAAQSKRPTT